MVVLSLGEKVKQLRQGKEMSLRELAGDFVSKAHLSLVENNKRSPNLKLLEYLAEKLDINLEYLLETELQQVERYCKLWIEEMKSQAVLLNLERVLELSENIFRYADEYNLIEMLGQTNLILGQTYLSIKKFDKAQKYIDSAILYFYEIKDYRKLSISLVKLGNVYYRKGLYEISLNNYQRALSFYGKLDVEDLKLKSNIYFNLAACHNDMKNSDLAIRYADEVCKIDKEVSDKERYAKSLIKFSSTLIRANKYEDALCILRESNNVLDNEYQPTIKAQIENNLGYIYLKTDQLDKAYEHLLEAKQLKVSYNPEDLPSTLYELHKYYLLVDEESKALEVLEEALEFSKIKGLKKYIIEGLNLYIDYYIKKEDDKSALEKFPSLIDVLKSTQRKKDLVDVYLKKGNLLMKVGKEKESLQAFNKGYELNIK
ncbi:helix-turn-helix domain-containing protein [Sporosalibacterium faouarense]|uniref:helix-turn-helix domain-containing protein n=1 Tax=Sporosalibacterium faouarense TaxID=516123 RepID=UPI00141C5C4D|nr:helix-turn-helix domain-containing protein [Sporosalibacterium faouarense]MTI46634.1 tetratricopeptide repeat protein [Bacillota bacterium]